MSIWREGVGCGVQGVRPVVLTLVIVLVLGLSLSPVPATIAEPARHPKASRLVISFIRYASAIIFFMWASPFMATLASESNKSLQIHVAAANSGRARPKASIVSQPS